jgi:hypothetical protein
MRAIERRSVVVVATALIGALVAGLPVEAKKKMDEGPVQVTHDGLHLVPDTEVAAAWVKPGADFSGYDRIMLLDAYVAFRKDWERDQRRSRLQTITKSDIERMKREVGGLFREVFTEELGGEDGYPMVEEADDDVLLLRPAIIDLDVTAPDVRSTARTYNFAASAGAATLFLELYDSVSGEILARVIDSKVAGESAFMRWSNQVTNRAAAREVLAGWAGLLRQRLDEIHAGAAD